MRSRLLILTGLILLLLGGGLWWGRHSADRSGVRSGATLPGAVPPTPRLARASGPQREIVSESAAPQFFVPSGQTNSAKPDPLAYRLSNTTKTSGQLLRDDRAILLENALIDSSRSLGFKIPEHLRAVGDPGSYIVQSRGLVDDGFRAALADAGAEFVAYVPNNAWLVRASADAVNRLAASPETQAVLPWEPVYKLKSELLGLALENKALPPEAKVNLLVFAGAQAEVRAQLQKLNLTPLAEDRSPFGTVITVQPGADWTALALLPGVQLLERAYPRARANDLTRVQVGVATNSITVTNHLELTGTNVLVNVNDSGVDQSHPDLTGRVFGATLAALVDNNGHGTHVAAILAGSGLASTNVTNARLSINPATNFQYRGIAPGAKLFVQRLGAGLGATPDAALQEGAAQTNALISNNSWTYVGDSSYSLAAASYDAAVRDSRPGVTGSQPVLYVFAAGNSGAGASSGIGGESGSVLSPATAKNVLSVGAIELARDITNIVQKISGGTTNETTPWKEETSSGTEVASFSSRGNVGVRVEGDFGRFKPDVVAPGTFVISARSTTWDEVAYYNPTNHEFVRIPDVVVQPNTLKHYPLFLPPNTVGFTIQLVGNEDSPVPLTMPIYVRRNDLPTPLAFDLRRTNFVAVPPDLGGVGTFVGQNWNYAIGNPTGDPVSLDIITEVITTNDWGNYYQVLSNLNNSISSTNGTPPHFYRYESGTSMAAAAASGSLALIQEFFEQRLRVTNSPALLKAMLINGARSISPDGNPYDFNVQSSPNYEGWGLINLANSLPAGISNALNWSQSSPGAIKVVDQSPTNALATGQSKTRSIKLDDVARAFPLRITLAWTDPPGNPAVGVKLVNDLDLIVTNRDTGDIYFGNDIPVGRVFNAAWDTNDPPSIDAVNNVENVYLTPALGTNYDVTVMARRVNVNAVTAHANDVVQDYALVISSGNGQVTNAISFVSETAIISRGAADVVFVTNSIIQPDFVAASLQNQRLGANTPLLPAINSTNGMTNQWKFYVVTNTTSFTNAAFLISQQTDLSVPRQGVFTPLADEYTRRYADLDLYVSENPALTNLDPAVVAASFQSRTRNDLSGDEFLLFEDSGLNRVYYIGVKSEDQMAAEYEFFAIFSLFPLGAEDANGFVRAYPMSGYDIPDGVPGDPGGMRMVAITRPSTTGFSESVRRVIVTNHVSHANYADIIASVSHNSRAVYYDNHRDLQTPPYPVPPGPYEFLYDDSGESDFPNAIPPSGPGRFDTFMGEAPGGTWYFTYSDDRESQVGTVRDVRLRVERQCESDCSLTNTIAPNGWRYFSRNIPVEATNFTVCIDIISTSPQPLQLYIRKAGRPTTTLYDFTMTIPITGGCLTIDKSTLPPLQSGRYFIGVFNPNPTAQEFVYTATVSLGAPPTPTLFSGNTGSTPLLDDAVTNYTQSVTNDAFIARVDVGLRIDHPRVSDLAVTLVSPRGTRVLLVENRGGTDPNGFGTSLTVTNFVPVNATGGPAGVTNFIDTGATMGTVTIDYSFFELADQMTVYYQGALLTNTFMVPGSGRLTLNYGPGSSTIVEVRMNEFGNANTNTAWEYTVSSINSSHNYLIFTDNTNKTTTPVKFAAPPFVGTAGFTTNISDFEAPTVVQDYNAPQIGNPDGWNVLTNTVTVITNTAYTGTNSLALRSGAIQRTLPTVAGRTYRLGYAYRRALSLDGIVGWWPGNTNTLDIVNGNNAVLSGGANYGAGNIAQGFSLDGVDDRIVAAATPPLDFGPGADFSIEGWIQAFPSATDFGVMTILDKRSAPNTFECLGIAFYLQNGNLAIQMSDGVVPNATWNAYPSAGPNLQDGTFHHVAASVQRNSTTGGRLYVDGVLVWTFDPTLEPGSLITSAPLRIGNHDDPTLNCFFNGVIDEITIFNRSLSGAEVQNIYAAGTAGKCGMVVPPDVCSTPLGAQISVPGQVTNSFLGTTNWQLGGLIFTATNTNTLVILAPLNPNVTSGVLVDSFTLIDSGGPRYVLPEESLKALEGENAFGEWKLEVLDTRTGAFNNVALRDWQLQFIFQAEVAEPTVLVPGGLITNTICADQIAYYLVDVPTWVRAVTNQLFFATGPLNVYFNQSIRPTGTNTAPLDYNLLIGQTNGIVTLTTNVPPPPGLPVLIPGQRYYIGIHNPSTNTCVTFGFVVDFDLVTFPPVVNLSNGVPYCAVNSGPAGTIDYYRFVVSSNSVRAQFQLFNLNGDLTLLLRQGLPPTFGVFDYLSANVFTNDEVINVFDFSTPVALAPGDWYIGAANVFGPPISYCIRANEWPVYGTNIVITNTFLATNSFCLTWTSLPGVNYTVEGITNLTSTNWANVSGTITAVDYSTTFCVALPSPFQFFRVREGVSLSTYVPPPVISTIRRTFRGVELTWGGPVTARYQVQWSPTLVPTVWTTFPLPPQVTSTTGLFQFLDDGSQTGGFGATRYYRLVLLP